MAWIETVPYEESTGKLRKLYDRVKGPDNNVDNIMMAHSLRPHSMEGHMAIYKYVLHHTNNTVPKWFLETIGVWVSLLNKCNYCVDHHFSGLTRLVDDDAKSNKIWKALDTGSLDTGPFDEQQQAALKYAKALTLNPDQITEQDIEVLRKTGLNDGEILEINQVTAYFCYANRTVMGLGCTIRGDVLGLSPNNSNDENDWSHN
ncbi:MAG: peroxidase-related enzyme [Rhodospirillales bacterium]|nr:peroxidase-related enzyme [Rhodospirillales bacterium]